MKTKFRTYLPNKTVSVSYDEKSKMSRLYLLTTLIILFLFGCDSIDKDLVGDAVKLNSPYSDFSLYRYHVESSMAFGSGFTALKILPISEKCDYTDRDFFSFDNYSYPFFIKWKNKDTLSVKCLIDGGGLAKKQPVQKDIKKWKDWVFEVEYYSPYSAGNNGDDTISSYKIGSKLIQFNSDRDLLIFKTNEIVLALDSNKVSLTRFKVDTFQSKTGLSSTYYNLKMNKNYKLNDFKALQPFIVTKP